MDGISFAQDVVFGDAWIIVNANGDLIINPQNYTPQPGDVVLSVGEGELVNPSPENIASEINVSVVEADGSINSVDVSDRVQEALGGNGQDGDEPQSEDRDDGSSLTASTAVQRDGAETIAQTAFDTEGLNGIPFTPAQETIVEQFIFETVALINSIPEASDDSFETSEDAKLFGSVPIATDSDGEVVRYQLVSGVDSGELIFRNDGSFDFDPGGQFDELAPGESEEITFEYIAVDDQGDASEPKTITIVVTGENDAPTAVDDSFSGKEGDWVLIDFLGNDFDIDGDEISVVDIQVPAELGEVSLQEDGNYYFIPADENLNGDIEISYTIQDELGATDSAKILVTLSPENDPPLAQADEAETDEDTAVIIDVLDNDVDVDGDELTIISAGVLGEGDSGSVEIVDGKLVFTPTENFNGFVEIEYTISDGNGGESTASVYVAVNAVNDRPTAVDDSYQTQEYQAVLIDPLANDFDVDGDDISIVSISVPEEQGVVYQDEGGQYYFSPAEGFSGEATISYIIQDELGLQDSAEIFVSVEEINEAPEITVTVKTVTEGEVEVGDPVAEYETYDEEDDELEVDFTPGTNDDGFYELVDGEVLLTQPGVDWVNAGNLLPPVDLTVNEVNSDLSGSDSATPNVNLQNDAPTIEITPLTVFENQTDEGDTVATFVTSDEENDDLIVSFAPGSNADGYYALEDGKVVLTTKGAEFVNAGNALPLIALVVTETKAGGLSGADDGTPTVIEANDPPEISVVAGTVTEDATSEGDEVATYTVNDEDEDQLEVDFTEGTNDDGFYELANGKVVLTEAGADWVNAGNELPPVDLTVREVGSEGLADSASDTPTVNTVNDKPVLTVTETNDFIENQASENDVVAKYETFDEDGDDVTVSLSDETYYKLDDNGNVLLTEEGADLVNSGQELPPFTLTPNDGAVDGDAKTVDPSVIEVNDKPLLTVTETNDFIENQASENDVVAKYETFDEDGDDVTVTLSDETYYQLDDSGNVLLTEEGADLVNSGQELPPFTLTPNDGTIDGDARTVDPTVTEVNDAPEFISGDDIAGDPANDDSYDFGSVPEGTTAGTIVGQVEAFDEDNDELKYLFSNGTDTDDIFTIDTETGEISLNVDVDDGDLGLYECLVIVRDPDGQEDSALITIDLTNVDDPTVTQSDINQTNEDATLTVNAAKGVLSNDTDVDDTLTVASFKVADDDTTYDFGDTAVIDGVGEFTLNADGSYEFVPVANFNGDVPTITYTTNTGVSDTLDIDVVAQNDPTVTQSDTNQTNEDTTLTVNAANGVLSNDSDVDDTLTVATFKVAGDDTTYNFGEKADIDGVGEFMLNADGSYEFVPADNFNGDVPTVTYTTNTGASDTLDIDVVAQDDPTVTGSDTNQTNEDTTLTVNAATGVLSNDSDVDDTLSVATFKVAGDDTTYNSGETADIDGVGEFTLNADGSYEFVPAVNFNGGVPTITYTTNTGVSDTLDIDVVAQNDPTVTQSDTNQTNEDATLTVNAANGVLSNDTDVDDTLTVASFKVANDDTTYSFGETAEIDGVGEITLNADGSYEFVPAADFNGDVPTITYTTNTGASDTLDIDVVAKDDPTVTVEDTNQTNEDATLTVNAANGVLSNDTDVDDTLTVASFKVANDDTTYSFGETAEIDGVGGFTLNADGSYEFVPAADFNGDVPIITYTTNTGASDTLDIDVVAQDDPTVTASDTNQTNEDATLTVNAANGVLSNDTDVDDTLTVASFKVANDDTTYSFGETAEIDGVGEFTLNADGSYEFVPAADFNGDVPIITYTTNTGASDTLDIDVVAQDDPTVTASDTNQTNEDTTLTVNAANGVLNNDTDVDDTLTVASFKVANDDTTYSFGDTAEIDGVGEITLNADGSYEFVPAADFNGDVPTITYTTNTGASDTLDIDVVAQDDPTVTAPDTNQTNEDTTLTVNAATGVLSNDSDVDDTLTVATFQVAGDDTTYNFGETADIDGVGEFTLNADGSYEFVPADNFNGDVPTVTYTTNTGASDTLDIDVVAQDDPTVTGSDTNQTNEDTTLTVNAATGVLSNDSDVDDTLTVATFKVAGDDTTYNFGETADIDGVGEFTLNADGSYEFVPASNFNGDVPTITYTTNTGASDTLDIDVVAQNDPTVTQSDTNQTNEDTTLTVNAANGVLSNDSDPDDTLTVATFKVSGDGTTYNTGMTAIIAGIGSITVNANGSYEFVPGADFNGDVPTITYTTNTGVSDTLDIDVAPQADPTITVSDSNQTNEDTTLTVNAVNGVLSNDSDADGPLSVATFKVFGDNTDYVAGDSVGISGIGTVTLNGDGSYEFVPFANFSGTVPTITYTTDTGVSDTLDIDIVAVADEPNLWVVNEQKEASIDFQDAEGLLGADEDWSSDIDVSQVLGDNTLGTWYANDDNKVEIGRESIYRSGASDANLILEIEGDNGDNSIYTDISVKEGRYYSFTFDVAARRWENGDSDLDVIWVRLDDQGNPIMDEAMTLYQFRPEDNGWQRDVQITLPSDMDGNYRLLVQSTDANSYGAIVDNLVLESSDARGFEDTFVDLWDLGASLADTDGSETLAVTMSGLPEGTIIKDGNDVEVVAGADGIVDITALDIATLKANVPVSGEYTVTVTATATETSNGDQASKSVELPLVIEDRGYQLKTGSFGDDVIDGSEANELIVGDVQGFQIEAGEDYNIAFILDTSGSMRNIIETAKLEIIEAVNQIIDTGKQENSGMVRIMLTEFASSAQVVVELDLSTLTAEQAKSQFANAVGALNAENSTNYEAAFETTIDWFVDTGIAGANNQTFFITDGEPTRGIELDEANANRFLIAYTADQGLLTLRDILPDGFQLDEDGDDVYFDGQLVVEQDENDEAQVYSPYTGERIGELTRDSGQFRFTDRWDNDEEEVKQAEHYFAILNEISNVDAIGLGSGVDIDTLVKFDSDGVVEPNIDVSELEEVILGKKTSLLPGQDEISSAGGTDILFGDGVQFDGIEEQGVAAIQKYVAQQLGELEANVYPRDLFEYIEENVAEFNLSTENDKADDLDGGTGDDILFGQGGDDILVGGVGNDILVGGLGEDTLTGGADADTFIWTEADLTDSPETDTITDFSINEGDTIDLSDIFGDVTDQNEIDAILQNLEDSVQDNAGTSSITVEKDSKSVTIEFEGVSGSELINNLDTIVNLNDT